MPETLERTTTRITAAVKPLSPEEQRSRDQDAEHRLRSVKASKIEDLRSTWNAPKRHVDCKPKQYGEWVSMLDFLRAKLGGGFMVALVGGRGNGKTMMAVELMKHVTDGLNSALYATSIEFFINIKRSYRLDSQIDEMDVIKRFRKPSFLVIDEIGKRGQSDWENNMLFELLNKRYGDMTDTLLIDNIGKAEFIAAIGPSLASRMQETGGIIEASWQSFRS